VKNDDGLPIPDILVVLKTLNGTIVVTTLTNSDGEYIFTDITPGDYNIVQTNTPEYPLDVSDKDTTPDGDTADSVTVVDSIIGITVVPGEKDTGNDFVDSNKGSIGGTVTTETGEPLANVTIILTKPDGTTVTTVTDSSGGYTFVDLPPGDYTLKETNPPGFPDDVSDYDQSPDGDFGDSDTVPDNKIVVTIKPGEKDIGNNFVDKPATPAPTGRPTPSPTTKAPTLAPTPAPFILTAPPNGNFCEKVPDPKCKLCAASRSLGKFNDIFFFCELSTSSHMQTLCTSDYCKDTEIVPCLDPESYSSFPKECHSCRKSRLLVPLS
jgi:hypothetical protein